MLIIPLKVEKGETKCERDLVIISEKARVDAGDLNDICTVKVKIEHSRKEYLWLRMKQEAYRKRYLKNTNRLKLWHREKTKIQCEK